MDLLIKLSFKACEITLINDLSNIFEFGSGL